MGKPIVASVLQEVAERFDGVDNGYCRLCRWRRLCDEKGRPQHCVNANCLSGRIHAAMYHVPEGCKLVAHDTGDGWALSVDDEGGEQVAILDWPKAWPESLSAKDLRAIGFEVV